MVQVQEEEREAIDYSVASFVIPRSNPITHINSLASGSIEADFRWNVSGKSWRMSFVLLVHELVVVGVRALVSWRVSFVLLVRELIVAGE